MTRDVGRDAILRDGKWTPVQVSSYDCSIAGRNVFRPCEHLRFGTKSVFSSLNFVSPRTGPEPGVGNLHFAHRGPARGAIRAEHHAAARRGVWNAFNM